MAGKLAPKKYGDRILTEQQQLDAQGNPITILRLTSMSAPILTWLHPKQLLALKTRATEVLYGGAAGGGPSGKRNGQYRHGERTKAAIAKRRKFSALLKHSPNC